VTRLRGGNFWPLRRGRLWGLGRGAWGLGRRAWGSGVVRGFSLVILIIGFTAWIRMGPLPGGLLDLSSVDSTVVVDRNGVPLYEARGGDGLRGETLGADALPQTPLDATLAAEYPEGVQIRYQLHPPILRALGWKKKIALGPWFKSAFRVLTKLRGLRGTALDPFRYPEVRRVERALVGEYRGLIEKVLADLSPETYDRAVKLANLPDVIRGYEDIKLKNVARFRAEVRSLGF